MLSKKPVSIHVIDSLCEKLLEALLDRTNAGGTEETLQTIDAGKKP